ncbi:MAG TPA: helix-turn-helix domain-containing protein [Solimonas sp.]|nr:helix-turn-helix domain-containing protein [Solimonas sp.]
MARPQLASDEEIFSAAERVLVQLGGHRFSIAAVAEAVGLSRAAIILRFKSTEALRDEVLKRMVQAFIERMNAISGEPGGNTLLLLASAVGAQVSRRGLGTSFFDGGGQNRSELLQQLVRIRSETIDRVIARAMPELHIARREAVAMFSTHLGGTVLAWQSMENADLLTLMIERSRTWLELAGIPYDKAFARSLLPAPRKSGPVRKAAAAKKVPEKKAKKKSGA